MHEPSIDEKNSEKSSVRSVDTSTMTFKILQEISLCRLMAHYAAKVLHGTDHSDSKIAAREDVNSAKWQLSRDSNMKVYSVVAHPLNSEILICASSIGVVVIRIGSSVDMEHHFGSHPAWIKKGFLLTFNETFVQKSMINMSGGLLLSTTSNESTVESSSRVGSANLSK
jgi:hypothetical protein